MTIITIHMHKNDGLEKKKKFFFFVFSHPGGSVSLPGVREWGRISGRLPDDPGGFTCMDTGKILVKNFTQYHPPSVHDLKVKFTDRTLMLMFYVKVFRTSIFPNLLMDLFLFW